MNKNINLEFLEEKKDIYGIQEKLLLLDQQENLLFVKRGNKRNRMQILTRNGLFIKKISIRYIDILAGLAITQQGLISYLLFENKNI
jgi:hypothetical protein